RPHHRRHPPAPPSSPPPPRTRRTRGRPRPRPTPAAPRPIRAPAPAMTTFRRCANPMTWMRPYFLALALLVAAPLARAQSNKVAAEALFEEGRRLMSEGKVADACPKFADSQSLDPSPGTLLNLASCYEKMGMTATAWATYREAASLASAS